MKTSMIGEKATMAMMTPHDATDVTADVTADGTADGMAVQRVRALLAGLGANEVSDAILQGRYFPPIPCNQLSDIFGSGLQKAINIHMWTDPCKDCGFDQRIYFPRCPVCSESVVGCKEIRTILPPSRLPRGADLVGHPIYVFYENSHWYGGVVSAWWQATDSYVVSFLDNTSASLRLFDDPQRLWRPSGSLDIILPTIRDVMEAKYITYCVRQFELANEFCQVFRSSRMTALNDVSLPFPPPILRIILDFLAFRDK